MKVTFAVIALLFLSACEQQASAPPPPPQPAPEDKESVELKVNPEEGAVEFKKESGEGGDDVSIQVDPEKE